MAESKDVLEDHISAVETKVDMMKNDHALSSNSDTTTESGTTSNSDIDIDEQKAPGPVSNEIGTESRQSTTLEGFDKGGTIEAAGQLASSQNVETLENFLIIDGETEVDDIMMAAAFANYESAALQRNRQSIDKPSMEMRQSEAYKEKAGHLEDLLQSHGLELAESDDDEVSDAAEEAGDVAVVSDGIVDFENEEQHENNKKSKGHINLFDFCPIKIEGLPLMIPESASLRSIGKISSIIDQTVLVQAAPVSHFKDIKMVGFQKSQPLDLGSVLCLSNRKVVGPVSDTFGPISAPFYVICLSELSNEISQGDEVFADLSNSTFIMNATEAESADYLRGKFATESDGEISDDSDCNEKESIRDKIVTQSRENKEKIKLLSPTPATKPSLRPSRRSRRGNKTTRGDEAIPQPVHTKRPEFKHNQRHVRPSKFEQPIFGTSPMRQVVDEPIFQRPSNYHIQTNRLPVSPALFSSPYTSNCELSGRSSAHYSPIRTDDGAPFVTSSQYSSPQSFYVDERYGQEVRSHQTLSETRYLPVTNSYQQHPPNQSHYRHSVMQSHHHRPPPPPPVYEPEPFNLSQRHTPSPHRFPEENSLLLSTSTYQNYPPPPHCLPSPNDHDSHQPLPQYKSHMSSYHHEPHQQEMLFYPDEASYHSQNARQQQWQRPPPTRNNSCLITQHTYNRTPGRAFR